MIYILNEIDRILSEKFEKTSVNNKDCFKVNDGTIFKVSFIEDFNGFVVEYAENDKNARNSLFEEGDLINCDLKIEEIIKMILNEIRTL
ncbi:hypothetical protein HMPREF2758_02755 [Facklamia sp. HMSC062C11]|uniref:Uncharacterized protein n=1 Tax=Facklamia hominis TaxID=178214 RepID=A0AAJ1Q5J5_9LACT|nr:MULTISPECIES: hypothetical protein [Facklamia]MDK7187149.1 hypothetical protein [Facklamia hominis]OFL65095.1 hypothetical protein HMPREF2758_02755 [Facklamia sp. HMSC062C11]